MVVRCPQFKKESPHVWRARSVPAFSNDLTGGRRRESLPLPEVNLSDTAFNSATFSPRFVEHCSLVVANADSVGEGVLLTAAVSVEVLPTASVQPIPATLPSLSRSSLSENGAHILPLQRTSFNLHFSGPGILREVYILPDEEEKSLSQEHHLLVSWAFLLIDFAFFLLILWFLAMNVGVLALVALLVMMIVSLFGALHAWAALTYPDGSFALSALALPPLIIHGALALIIFLILRLISLALE